MTPPPPHADFQALSPHTIHTHSGSPAADVDQSGLAGLRYCPCTHSTTSVRHAQPSFGLARRQHKLLPCNANHLTACCDSSPATDTHSQPHLLLSIAKWCVTRHQGFGVWPQKVQFVILDVVCSKMHCRGVVEHVSPATLNVSLMGAMADLNTEQEEGMMPFSSTLGSRGRGTCRVMSSPHCPASLTISRSLSVLRAAPPLTVYTQTQQWHQTDTASKGSAS